MSYKFFNKHFRCFVLNQQDLGVLHENYSLLELNNNAFWVDFGGLVKPAEHIHVPLMGPFFLDFERALFSLENLHRTLSSI